MAKEDIETVEKAENSELVKRLAAIEASMFSLADICSADIERQVNDNANRLAAVRHDVAIGLYDGDV